MLSVQSNVCRVKVDCAEFSVPCAVTNSTQLSVQCVVCIVHFAVYYVQCAVVSAQCAVYSMQSVVCNMVRVV